MRLTSTPPGPWGALAGAVVACLSGACQPAISTAEEDLGPIEQTVDELARTVWPGVEGEQGRFLPLLNGFFGGGPTAFWFAGFAPRHTANIFWFCRQGDTSCPFDEAGEIARDRAVGDPVYATQPGEADHSPFWLMWVVRVPEDYVANDLKSTQGIQRAAEAGRVVVEQTVTDHGGDIGPAEALIHCLMVLEGTELEGNGGDLAGQPGVPSLAVPVRRGWHKQYRVNVYDFIDTEGVFAPNRSSESVPLMPESTIFLMERDCAGGSASPACGSSAAATAFVSERGIERDLTGDGDRRDTNDILAGFLGTPLGDDPWEAPYSPLWRVKTVRVPAEHDADVALIDTTADQGLSDARSVADLRGLFEAGRIEEPEDLREDPGGAIPGNDGTVFFNCHSQVAAP